MLVAHIKKLQENTAALYKMAPGNLNCRPRMLSGIPDARCPRIAKGDRLRVQGVGTPPPDDTERALLSGTTPSGFPKRTRAAMLSGLPQGEAHDTREHHTTDDSISYPDMLSGWKTLTKVSEPCYVIPTAFYNPCFAALRWCVRMPCPDIFAMDSKELSSISDCFGDQKAIKTPKHNTI
uniref:Uncharacterized protein n=1 Tax=Vitis vinifera TaxID=29760 RepID=A5BC78_VITVI|nr:hypothetical protein VITISV_006677 [Vitis vinifera]